jgi:hypothetical protein
MQYIIFTDGNLTFWNMHRKINNCHIAWRELPLTLRSATVKFLNCYVIIPFWNWLIILGILFDGILPA